MSEGGLLFWFLVLISTTALGVWSAVRERRKRKAVQGWRRVRGRIREARACEVHITANGDDNQVGYEPLVLYDYRIDGQDFVGTRVGLSRAAPFMTNNQAVSAVKRYKAGDEVDVYVDPANHRHALLDPRIKADWLTPAIGLGLIAAIVALLMLPHLLRGF